MYRALCYVDADLVCVRHPKNRRALHCLDSPRSQSVTAGCMYLRSGLASWWVASLASAWSLAVRYWGDEAVLTTPSRCLGQHSMGSAGTIRPWTLSKFRQTIQDCFLEKLKIDADSNSPETQLTPFVCEYFFNKYGVKRLVQVRTQFWECQ